MDPTLLETPLVFAPTAPTASSAARLRALSPQEYWLQLARELTWHTPPSSAHEGSFGDFRYFAGATGNVSVNCLDRVPAERVALHYEREDGLRETWSYGRLTDAVARFATVLSQLRGFGRGAVRS